MAFNFKFLQPVGGNAGRGQALFTGTPGSNAGASWNYAHPTDSLATIVGDGYFNEARDLLQKTDAIKIFDSTKLLRQVWVFLVSPSPSTANIIIDNNDLEAV